MASHSGIIIIWTYKAKSNDIKIAFSIAQNHNCSAKKLIVQADYHWVLLAFAKLKTWYVVLSCLYTLRHSLTRRQTVVYYKLFDLKTFLESIRRENICGNIMWFGKIHSAAWWDSTLKPPVPSDFNVQNNRHILTGLLVLYVVRWTNLHHQHFLNAVLIATYFSQDSTFSHHRV